VATSLATVVPSLWPENCPMVVLESLSAGTPVVHTGRGGLAEICPPGELGLRLPDDPVDWNAFVETLDGPRLAEMRPRCRKTAEQRYSLDTMVNAYERTFEAIGEEA
jgi:glycosyltransferase involved in cell wall biosynthesis